MGRVLKALRPSSPVIRREALSAAQQAARILEECEAECRTLRERAAREGWAHGFAEWQTAIESASKSADAYRASIEPDLGKLAVRIAAKIIGEIVEADRARVAGVVREALRSVSREKHLTVRVAPGFAAALEPHIGRLEERLSPDCSIRVTESPDVDPGGCVLVSELGVIDARVKTQLARIEEVLLGGSR